VTDGDIVDTLEKDRTEFLDILRSIPEEKAPHRYAEGKWSVRELLGHVIDAERVFTYRALRFGRGDETELASFDQEVFVQGGDFESRTVADLIQELDHVRTATLDLFGTMSDAAILRSGIASGNRVSTRALAWITAGHARHHMVVLQERYLAERA
jgi:Mycothiol maleylpyruvate isomerase N-terminal domain.